MIAIANANTKAWIRKITIKNTIAMSSSAVNPIIELREYAIKPDCSAAYIQSAIKTADLRKSLLPLRIFSFPDTGGQLHNATHAYYFSGGHAERDAKRTDSAACDEWKVYLSECRPYMQNQQSNIFVEAPLVDQFDEIIGLARINEKPLPGNDCILEFRRYKLVLGYDTVPKFMSFYIGGLPSKLHAVGSHPTTALVTVLTCEVGRLNEVIEIWRHGDGHAAMERSRSAARGAMEWRKAIAEIAPLAVEFTSTIHRPLEFSPLH